MFFRYSYVVICLFHYLVRVVTFSLSDSSGRSIQEDIKVVEALHNYLDIRNIGRREMNEFQEILKHEEELAHNPLDCQTFEFRSRRCKRRCGYDEKSFGRQKSGSVSPLDDHSLFSEIRNLVHLQRVYSLTVTELLQGHLASNVVVGIALTAEDCFSIGREFAEKYDHEAATDWLSACEDKYDEIIPNPISTILISSSLFTGHLSLCRKIVSKYLKKDKYNRMLVDLNLKLSQKLGNNLEEYEMWESFNVCAGDYHHELAYRNLKCRYNHRNSPFLTIAPLKEEILSVLPKISVFRDVVYDSEVERLKRDTYDKLVPGQILDDAGKAHTEPRFVPTHRTALYNMETEYPYLRNRLMDMSLLSFNSSIGLQFVYYVPGSFIRVHSDFRPKTDVSVSRLGHRITTAVLYLSDVTLGGETVFPRLRISVKPLRGSVLVFTNMKSGGTQETLSNHASCPISYGEKIIGTQWFRMKGQNYWITRPDDILVPRTQCDSFGRNMKSRKRMCKIFENQ